MLTDHYQRLKGAIDQRIAEEQSKAWSSNASSSQRPSPSAASSSSAAATRRSRSSSGTKTQSPARRPRKKPSEDTTNGDGPTSNPDPAVFEAAFVIDDTDESGTPARVATPVSADKSADQKPAGKTADIVAQTSPTPAATASQNAEKGETARAASDQAQQTSPATSGGAELSPEIRTRLRKLEKLEKTYPGT